MPKVHNPLLSDFYVYILQARDLPFYVGIGRPSRPDDRLRLVRSLIKQEKTGKAHKVKWFKSARIVAELLQRREAVKIVRLQEGLTWKEALTRKNEEIARLLASSCVPANHKYNKGRSSSIEEVMQFVLSEHPEIQAAKPVSSLGATSN